MDKKTVQAVEKEGKSCENHLSHICVDEMINLIREQLNKIEKIWNEKQLSCNEVNNIKVYTSKIGYKHVLGIDLVSILSLSVLIADKVEEVEQ